MHEKNTSTSSGGKLKQRFCKDGAIWDVTCVSLYTSQNQPKPTKTWGLGGEAVETVSNHPFPLYAVIELNISIASTGALYVTMRYYRSTNNFSIFTQPNDTVSQKTLWTTATSI